MDRGLPASDSRHGDVEEPRARRVCPNCGSSEATDYCPSCGQSQDEWIVSAGAWFRHTVSDLLEVEGTFLQTLRTLLGQPGRLTQAWIAGRRMSYMKPVRLYLLASTVLFGLLALPGLSMAGRDAVVGAVEGLAASSRRSDGAASGRMAALVTNPDMAGRIASSITENLPRAMFLLLPFAAFLMKVLVRPRRHYVVHMVWTLHVHAALYLVMAGMVLLNPLRGAAKVLVAYPLLVAAAGWACWYGVSSFSRVYEQSVARSVGILGLLGAGYVPVYLFVVVVISLLAVGQSP